MGSGRGTKSCPGSCPRSSVQNLHVLTGRAHWEDEAAQLYNIILEKKMAARACSADSCAQCSRILQMRLPPLRLSPVFRHSTCHGYSRATPCGADQGRGEADHGANSKTACARRACVHLARVQQRVARLTAHRSQVLFARGERDPARHVQRVVLLKSGDVAHPRLRWGTSRSSIFEARRGGDGGGAGAKRELKLAREGWHQGGALLKDRRGAAVGCRGDRR